jgi:hypothetical protein
MSGHRHNPAAATQNQGNALGDRACVRMSKLYRQHEGGNNMKALMGSAHLAWDADRQQGAYEGKPVYDHLRDNGTGMGMGYRGEAYQRHQHSLQDAYSKSSYETTSSGYGNKQMQNTGYRGYDENYSIDAKPPRRRVQQQGSVADSLCHDHDMAPPRSNGYAQMVEQYATDSGYRIKPSEYAVTTGNRRTSFGHADKDTRLW